MVLSCRRNLFLLPFYVLVSQEALTSALYVYHIQGLGHSPATLAGLLTLGSVVSALMEVPSGYLADRFGRRNSLLAGSGFQALGVYLMWRAGGLRSLAAAFAAISVGDALRSGADEALMYDTHRALRREDEFRLRWARVGAVALIMLAACEVGGGYLASVLGPDPVWAFEVGMSLLAVFTALGLMEVPPVPEGTPVSRDPSLLVPARGSLVRLFVTQTALSLTGFLVAFEVSAFRGPDTGTLGAVLAGRHMMMGVGAVLGGSRGAGVSLLLRGSGPIALGLLLVLALRPGGTLESYLLLMGLTSLLHGFLGPHMSEVVNRELDSGWRATGISMVRFAGWVACAVTIPVMGALVSTDLRGSCYLLLALPLVVTEVLRARWLWPGIAHCTHSRPTSQA